ncbi:hypothetical protein Cyrtocomes_01146 [Candidatus Cyrtobacter comes]|uniref:Uncharacterized protein n=1 Tax=Candidatus Cyrtobacter comes TaxID=675776 RepID=A0ABU5L9F3_9RICK|nr:hypothetical protein [Candidatus Cyrtobacter comes]
MAEIRKLYNEGIDFDLIYQVSGGNAIFKAAYIRR